MTIARCRTCGEQIEWCVTETGQPLAVDFYPTQDGNMVIQHKTQGEPGICHELTPVELAKERRQHGHLVKAGILKAGPLKLYRAHAVSCSEGRQDQRMKL